MKGAMMNQRRRSIAVALALWQTMALAQPSMPAHPACPQVSGKTWLEFVLGERSNGKTHYFQVRFDQMKKVPDPHDSAGPLGTVWKGSCYTVIYEVSQNRWLSSGTVKGRGSAVQYTPSKLADPKKYQLGINGRTFRFDEGGRVFDEKLGHVGSLHCQMLYPVPCIRSFADRADAKRLTGG
jgi:hypothetical protein